MANSFDFSKPYWFYISREVYVSSNGSGKMMLLYHTNTGEYIETSENSCILLVNEVYKPDNLGVVKLHLKTNIETDLTIFIENIIKHKMGGLIDLHDEAVKPVNLLPILSLANDVEKLQKYNNKSPVIPDLISYLSELNVHINGTCSLDCSLCSRYYKQIKSCFSFKNNAEMRPRDLQKILEQLKHSRVKKINVFGGNIFQYTYWDELVRLMSEYDFEFHLWTNYQNLPEENPSVFRNENIFKEIIVTFPIRKSLIEKVYTLYTHRTKFHFLIENKDQYLYALDLIDTILITDFDITPIFTENNRDFFSENIFLNKEDIFSSRINMRQIFRNQKLNANNFGVLIIYPDGVVKANANSVELGNISQSSMLELIYKELTENSAWRVIRNKGVCSSCQYQFLCPPPSNYETVIKKTNLCNVNNK